MTLKQEQVFEKMLVIFGRTVRQCAAYGEDVPFCAISDRASISYAARDRLLRLGYIVKRDAGSGVGGSRPVFSVTDAGRQWYGAAKSQFLNQPHRKV